MSIRIVGVWCFVAALSYYAWRRNWFISLCGLIFLMGFTQHPDMPTKVLGIPGLNPWNLLFFNVVFAWLANRRREGFYWDMPPNITWCLIAFFIVLLASTVPVVIDPDSVSSTLGSCLIEYVLNPIKYVVPGLILFDACRSRFRIVAALVVIVSLYVLVAIQVINYMPSGAIKWSGGELSRLGSRIIQSEVGYSRVTVSMMLSGAFWSAVSLANLGINRKWRWGWYAAAVVSLYGQALTGGRAGYLTWGVVGFIFCVVRFRRLLPLIPVAAIAIIIILPGVRERLFMGFEKTRGNIVVEQDTEVMTSGRAQVWPWVIKKIGEAPFFGYGRQAMVTTGLTRFLSEEIFGYPDFGHAHNAYLGLLLESGFIGFCGVMPIYILVVWYGLRLLRVRDDPIFMTAGGVSSGLVLGLLVAGMGAQHLHPIESSLGLWAAVGVMLRALVEWRNHVYGGLPLFGESETKDERPFVDEAPSPAAI